MKQGKSVNLRKQRNSESNKTPKIRFTYPQDIEPFSKINTADEFRQRYEQLEGPSGLLTKPFYKIIWPKYKKAIYATCRAFRCRARFKYVEVPQQFGSSEAMFRYKLHQVKRVHEHFAEEEQKRLKDQKLSKQYLLCYMKEAILKNPDVTFKSMKDEFGEKLGIQENNLRYIFTTAKSLVKDHKKHSILYESVKEHGYIFMCQEYESFSSEKFRFMITEEKWLANYQKYHRLTYCIISPNECQVNQREFGLNVGCFYGLDTNLELSPFAVFICKVNLKSIYMLMKEFFAFMDKNSKPDLVSGTSVTPFQLPQTIIMTYFKGFSEQLFHVLRENEVYSNDYLYEPVSVYSNLKEEFEKQRKSCFHPYPFHEQTLYGFMSEPSARNFSELLELENSRLGNTFGVESGKQSLSCLETFLEVADRCCISQTECYLGAHMFSRSEVKKDSLYLKYSLQKSAKNSKHAQFGYVDKVYEHVNGIRSMNQNTVETTENKYESENYEELLKMPELAKIKFLVQKKIFAYIVKMISKGLYLKTYKQSHILMFVYETEEPLKKARQDEELRQEMLIYGRPSQVFNELLQEVEISRIDPNQQNLLTEGKVQDLQFAKMRSMTERLSRQQFYEVTYDRKEQRWTCECGLYHRRGLPCQHELVICVRYKYSVEKQIGVQWIRQENLQMFESGETRCLVGRRRGRKRKSMVLPFQPS